MLRYVPDSEIYRVVTALSNNDKVMCSEAVASALGMPDPARIDPALLHALCKRFMIKR